MALLALVFLVSYRGALAYHLPGGPPTAPQGRASKSGSIKGRVIDDEGRPLAGASVILMPAGGDQQDNESQTVRTDEDGRFIFDPVADKPYTIAVGGFESSSAGYHLPGENVTIRVEKGGVITGRVSTVNGEPLVGLQVVAKRVGAKAGKPALRLSYEPLRTRLTDDRGIYRFWGLQPGVYVVSAGPWRYLIATAYDDDSPTYYPSSTLGSAGRIELDSGQELTGIDITYRGYSGHTVSGTVTGGVPQSSPNIWLSTPGGDDLDSVYLPAGQPSVPFAFSRVSDGDYVVVAASNSRNGISALSPPRAVSVKGADVTRIDLKPVPLGSVSGRISLQDDPTLGCKNKHDNTLAEVLLSLKCYGPPKDNYPSFIKSQLTYAASLAANGDFSMKRVPAGAYRLDFWLPNPDWYVSAIAQGSGPRTAATKTARDVAANGISINDGQAVSGLNIVIKNGAASLSGRVVIEKSESHSRTPAVIKTTGVTAAPGGAGRESAPGPASPTVTAAMPSGLMVYLIPAEQSRVGDQPRSYETEASSDGSYQFKNLAPGRYRITVGTVQEKEHAQPADQAVQQAPRRSRNGRDEMPPVIELHHCETRTDYLVSYPQNR